MAFAEGPCPDGRCEAPPVTGNLLLDYYDRLPAAIAGCVTDVDPVLEDGRFAPGFHLPPLDEDVARFLAAATAQWRDIGHYGGHRLALLDLTGNPGTHTTKTFASLLIVARAVAYIRRTGEPIVIFSPTSANKGTALRDAVLRAIEAGLVGPDELRVVILAPASCRDKLRASRLSEDPALRTRNPLLLYTGERAETVKAIGREAVDRHAAELHRTRGARLWYSMELRNYLVADLARAFFEQSADPTDKAEQRRLHAHAVSSAFGLLGYHQGRATLEAEGAASVDTRPASLLVQHLGTPDMVLSLRHGGFDRANLPTYARDAVTGRYRQDADPHFPTLTDDPAEVLDPTFYTHQPATSPAMNAIIERHGGDGIVVSLYECLARYPQLRDWLAPTDRPLPADFRTLREWSLVMAFTGVCNAIDRGLVPDGCDVVVHGSGSYGTADYEPLGDAAMRRVGDVADVAGALLG